MVVSLLGYTNEQRKQVGAVLTAGMPKLLRFTTCIAKCYAVRETDLPRLTEASYRLPGWKL